MGIIYNIVCHECKVYRYLDKLSPVNIKTRNDAVEYTNNKINIREALLVSFMQEHLGHECVLLNDMDNEESFFEIENDYEEDSQTSVVWECKEQEK